MVYRRDAITIFLLPQKPLCASACVYIFFASLSHGTVSAQCHGQHLLLKVVQIFLAVKQWLLLVDKGQWEAARTTHLHFATIRNPKASNQAAAFIPLPFLTFYLFFTHTQVLDAAITGKQTLTGYHTIQA